MMSSITSDQYSRASRHRGGFTIVELAVTIVIVGILAAITLFAYTNTQTTARNTAAKEELSTFGRMMVTYKADHGAYPSSTTQFTGKYAVSFTKSLFSETSYYNLLYCAVSPYRSYALIATTRSGMKIFVTDTGVAEEYSGSANWTVNDTVGICSSVLPGTNNAGVVGFRLTGGSPNGWRPWTGGL